MAYLTNRPAKGNINTPFGPRPKPTPTSPAIHYGQDYGWGGGDNIYAARSGTVKSYAYSGAYGNRLVIDHGDYDTWYCHLAGTRVVAGSKVTGGQHIAYMGATGNVIGKHLHFELRNLAGVAVNPEPFFVTGTAPAGDIIGEVIEMTTPKETWAYQIDGITAGGRLLAAHDHAHDAHLAIDELDATLTGSYTYVANGETTTGSPLARIAATHVRLMDVQEDVDLIAADVSTVKVGTAAILKKLDAAPKTAVLSTADRDLLTRAAADVNVSIDGTSIATALATNDKFIERIVAGVTAGLVANADVKVNLAGA